MVSIFLYAIIVFANLVSCEVVVLSGNGDIIQGETAQFNVTVIDDSGIVNHDEYRFEWSDNAVPPHSAVFKAKSPAVWNVTFESDFPPDVYTVTVKVYKFRILIWTLVGSSNKTFDVTSYLKGDIVLSQGNLTRKKFVSNANPVSHHIALDKAYLDFLNKTKNFIRTFWFVDCIYYGQSSGLDFTFSYDKVDKLHHVEALLVATYLNKTTHIMPNSTEKHLLSNGTSLTVNGTINMLPSGNSSVSNETLDYTGLDEKFKNWLLNFNQTKSSNVSASDYCINSTVIPVAFNYTYGFFRTNYTVKAPVKISPINGTNWLMDGEVLNITVSCNGSSPYSFCVLLKAGLYNVTGRETCTEENVIRNCTFGIQHLFKKASEYTLVVIISNSVSRVVKPIAVNIYKVKKHAQLSVIIVPVSFSLIATILIIFGVAYYVQSKRKYTIEVADFDFGNQTSNMEYKSFTERLRESISNSLLKSHDYQDSDDSWPESASTSRKYGSMQ